jgi:hypothetical protein
MKIFMRGSMMQENCINPKCVPKTKGTVGCTDAIKYVFVETL